MLLVAITSGCARRIEQAVSETLSKEIGRQIGLSINVTAGQSGQVLFLTGPGTLAKGANCPVELTYQGLQDGLDRQRFTLVSQAVLFDQVEDRPDGLYLQIEDLTRIIENTGKPIAVVLAEHVLLPPRRLTAKDGTLLYLIGGDPETNQVLLDSGIAFAAIIPTSDLLPDLDMARHKNAEALFASFFELRYGCQAIADPR